MVSRAWVLVKLGSAEESRVLDAMFWLFERLGGLESAMLRSGVDGFRVLHFEEKREGWGGGGNALWLGLELGLSWLEIEDRSEESLRGTDIVFLLFSPRLDFFLSSSVFVAWHSKSAH